MPGTASPMNALGDDIEAETQFNDSKNCRDAGTKAKPWLVGRKGGRHQGRLLRSRSSRRASLLHFSSGQPSTATVAKSQFSFPLLI